MRSTKRTSKSEAKGQTPGGTPTEVPAGLTRREALTTGAGAVAAVALAGCPKKDTPPTSTTPSGPSLLRAALDEDRVPGSLKSIRVENMRDANVPRNFKPNLAQPPVLRSGPDQRIRRDVVLRKATLNILHPDKENPGEWDYRQVTTRTYNGEVPGPTLEVNPGDRLEFTLHNQLDNEEPDLPEPYGSMTCEQLMALDIPHCFNITNLHTHGLHVSPSSKDGVASDDISIKILPDHSQAYCIWLPTFHAPGTHWYHAHVHGSTALQVADGAAGALIVKENDANAEIPVDDDQVWLIQEIVGEPSDEVYAVIKVPAGEPLEGTPLYGTTQPNPTFTVNGQVEPVLEMETDQIHRWRLINGTGTPRGYMNVVLEKDVGDGSGTDTEPYTGTDTGLHLMAVDGITFYGKNAVPVPAEGHFMAPGNRADFLVQIPDPGTYWVIKKKAVIRSNNNTGPTSDQLLVKIEVAGTPQSPSALPPLPGVEHEPCYLKPIENDEVSGTQSIEFSVTGGGVYGGYLINGQPFGEDPPAITADYQAVEEWTLTNTSGAAHPFHIHVNPFQVVGELIDPEGEDIPSNWRWQDVVSVPPQEGSTPGEVKIRQRFLTYSGAFVIHCHVLIHEDCGMMRNMEVGPGGAGACEGVDVCICPSCQP